MIVLNVLFVFVVFLLSAVLNVNGYSVFTYSGAETDETNLPMKIDKPDICATSNSSTELPLLIIVNSALGNFAKRAAIRDTWGRVVSEQGVPMLFLVASTNDAHLQSCVETEENQFNDIIQTPLMESYQNVTLKTMVMMRFISQNCAHAKWVLKLDDDMLLHAKRIINFARTTNCRGAIFGRLGNPDPNRNTTDKNYCPEECYPTDVFPVFLTGGTVLFDAKLAKSMYEYAMTHPSTMSVVEDVFMFGVVAQALNISRVGFYGLDYAPTEHKVRFPNDVCAFTMHFSTEQQNIQRFRNLWKKFNQLGEPVCESVPELSQLTKCL